MSDTVDPRFEALCEQSVRDAKRIAELEGALRKLMAATRHKYNILRGPGVRDALDRAERVLSLMEAR